MAPEQRPVLFQHYMRHMANITDMREVGRKQRVGRMVVARMVESRGDIRFCDMTPAYHAEARKKSSSMMLSIPLPRMLPYATRCCCCRQAICRCCRFFVFFARERFSFAFFTLFHIIFHAFSCCLLSPDDIFTRPSSKIFEDLPAARRTDRLPVVVVWCRACAAAARQNVKHKHNEGGMSSCKCQMEL